MPKWIKRWYDRFKFWKLTQRLLDEENTDTFYTDIRLWLTQVSNYVDIKTINKRRFNPEFKNITLLCDALNVLAHKLMYRQTGDIRVSKKYLLVEDWLIDEDSYRVDIEEFIGKLDSTLVTIAVKLAELDEVDKRYYIGNYYAIIVTLRSFVEICHRR